MKLKDNAKSKRLIELLEILAKNPTQPTLGSAWMEITGGKYRGGENGYIDIDDVMDEDNTDYDAIDELLDDLRDNSLREAPGIASELLRILG